MSQPRAWQGLPIFIETCAARPAVQNTDILAIGVARPAPGAKSQVPWGRLPRRHPGARAIRIGGGVPERCRLLRGDTGRVEVAVEAAAPSLCAGRESNR